MAVPPNPRLSDVCAEFQVPTTTPLSAFRRGAGIVPDSPVNAGVPTTLPISLSQLAGAVRLTAVVNDASIDEVTLAPANPGVRIRMEPDGFCRGYRENGPDPTFFQWLIAGTANQFEFFAELVSGTAPSGPFGVWVPGNSTPTWILQTATPNATLECQIRVYVRIAGGATLDSGLFNMSVEKATDVI